MAVECSTSGDVSTMDAHYSLATPRSPFFPRPARTSTLVVPMIRRAHVRDVPAIKKLVDGYQEEGTLLPRSLTDLYGHVRDFFVLVHEGEIAGCVALEVVWENLAEIRTLVVAREARGHGYGDALVAVSMEEAVRLELPRVFGLTMIPDFFLKLGFNVVPKESLPQKVWNACANCAKFNDCHEIAVAITARAWTQRCAVEGVAPELVAAAFAG